MSIKVSPSDDEARTGALVGYVGSSSFKCSGVAADRIIILFSRSRSAAVVLICVTKAQLNTTAAFKAAIGCFPENS